MPNRKLLYLGGVVAVALAVGGYWFAGHAPTTTPVPMLKDMGVAATPPGIILQDVAPISPVRPFLAQATGTMTSYANSDGKTLYTYDKDEPGRSICVGDCLKDWMPAEAPAGAKAIDAWTAIERDDGSKQWAFKGKPLYASVKDLGMGDNKGDGAVGGLWHIARFQPAADVAVPYGIAIQDVPEASGQVLIDDRRMTLYAFAGDVQRDANSCSVQPCTARWIPLAAPQIANAIGDFSVVTRKDGTKQWAFRGAPLYNFQGDLRPGDANGVGVDTQWSPAAVVRYFTPAEAVIRQSAGHGAVMTTISGMTLYRRDTSYHLTSGHGLSRSVPGIPAWGRWTGTKGCVGECLKVWHPLRPPADAQSSGYWSILVAQDGGRQWAYKGYALYTYDGDKKPGDFTGTDIYDVLTTDDLHDAVATSYGVVPTVTAATLYWAYAEP